MVWMVVALGATDINEIMNLPEIRRQVRTMDKKDDHFVYR